MKKYWEVHQPGDVEGRTTRLILSTTDEHLARAVASLGIGNLSMGDSFGDIHPFVACETPEEVISAISGLMTPDQEVDLRDIIAPETATGAFVTRRRALAKLTPEERKILGLLDR